MALSESDEIENILRQENKSEFQFKILGNGRVQIIDPLQNYTVLTVDKDNTPSHPDWIMCPNKSGLTQDQCGMVYRTNSAYVRIMIILLRVETSYFGVMDETAAGIKNAYNLLKMFGWFKKSATKVVNISEWFAHSSNTESDPANDWNYLKTIDNLTTNVNNWSRYEQLLTTAVDIVNKHPEVFTGSTNRSSRTATNARARNTIFRSPIVGSNIGFRHSPYGRVFGQNGMLVPFRLHGGDFVDDEQLGGAAPDFSGEHPIVKQLKNQVEVFEQYLKGNGKSLDSKTKGDYLEVAKRLNAQLEESDKMYYYLTKARLIPFDKNNYKNRSGAIEDEIIKAVDNYTQASKDANKNIHKFRVFINGLASTIAIQNLNPQPPASGTSATPPAPPTVPPPRYDPM